MIKNLVIGNTSQLSHYFSNEYEMISSRDIEFNKYSNDIYDKVFITFAEQRTFIENDLDLFTKINVDYTLEVIDFFKHRCNKIIWYSTIELWNNCEGEVFIDTPFNYNYTPYIRSKEIITNILKEKYSDVVIIIYPVNFNSIHRKGGFLFSKIFNSLLNREKIEIGNTYFERDISHPKIIVEKSINVEESTVVGSGYLININMFIRRLYESMNMDYDEYVTENIDNNLTTKRKTFFTNSTKIDIEKIIDYTIDEIKEN